MYYVQTFVFLNFCLCCLADFAIDPRQTSELLSLSLTQLRSISRFFCGEDIPNLSHRLINKLINNSNVILGSQDLYHFVFTMLNILISYSQGEIKVFAADLLLLAF